MDLINSRRFFHFQSEDFHDQTSRNTGQSITSPFSDASLNLQKREISKNQALRRSWKSILKEISPGCSLEGLMLKLKLQYFAHLMQRVDSLEKTLMLGGLGAGGEGDDRGWDGWTGSPIRWMWVWVSSGSWWWTGMPGVLWFMGSQRVRHDWVTELNWTELNRRINWKPEWCVGAEVLAVADISNRGDPRGLVFCGERRQALDLIKVGRWS